MLVYSWWDDDDGDDDVLYSSAIFKRNEEKRTNAYLVPFFPFVQFAVGRESSRNFHKSRSRTTKRLISYEYLMASADSKRIALTFRKNLEIREARASFVDRSRIFETSYHRHCHGYSKPNISIQVSRISRKLFLTFRSGQRSFSVLFDVANWSRSIDLLNRFHLQRERTRNDEHGLQTVRRWKFEDDTREMQRK